MAIAATVGARIGDYILVRKLGEGGMAEVWLARHHATAHLRALKFLNAQFQGIPEVEARFQNEGENQLVHPNIVRIYEVGQQDGSSFLAMEFIDGRDLEKIMDSRRGPLTVPEAVDMAMQILAGLGFAHANGIVHRDIKPSNVLVNSEGQAFLMDFGIAKALRTGRNMTQVNSRLGTPDYMSPEQIRNPRDVDSRSDIYSFGCLFYELLTGWPPFDRNAGYETEHDVKAAHVGEPPMPPMQRKNGLPIELDGIVLHCLAKAKEDRPQSCDEIIDALNAYRLSVTRSRQLYSTAAVVQPPKPATGPGMANPGTTGPGTTGRGMAGTGAVNPGVVEQRPPVVTPPNFPPLYPTSPPPYTSAEPPPLPPPVKPFVSITGPGSGQQNRTPTVVDTPVFAPGQAGQTFSGESKTTGSPTLPPLPADTLKGDLQKGHQKLLIALGSLFLVVALAGAGWVVFHKSTQVEQPTDPGTTKPGDVTKPDGDSTVTPGPTPDPEKTPTPSPIDTSKILPLTPGPGGKPDHSRDKAVIKPQPVTPSLASGQLTWTGNITSPAQQMVTVYLTNRSASVGTITGTSFPTQPFSIYINLADPAIIGSPPSPRTNYSTFSFYVQKQGQQTVAIFWTALPNR